MDYSDYTENNNQYFYNNEEEDNQNEEVEYYNFSTPISDQWTFTGVIRGITLVVAGLYVYKLYRQRRFKKAIKNIQRHI